MSWGPTIRGPRIGGARIGGARIGVQNNPATNLPFLRSFFRLFYGGHFLINHAGTHLETIRAKQTEVIPDSGVRDRFFSP